MPSPGPQKAYSFRSWNVKLIFPREAKQVPDHLAINEIILALQNTKEEDGVGWGQSPEKT